MRSGMRLRVSDWVGVGGRLSGISAKPARDEVSLTRVLREAESGRGWAVSHCSAGFSPLWNRCCYQQ
jgi:hypothetical protein